MKNLVLILLAMTVWMMTSSFCEPEPPVKRTITVERKVFEDLTKAAEKGQLCCQAVGSYESEIRNYRDSLISVNKNLEIKKKEYENVKDTNQWLIIGLIVLVVLCALLFYFLIQRRN